MGVDVITVRTFLRSEDGSFTPIEECATPSPDPHFVEGAIELTIGWVEIMGRSQWDCVNALWAYITRMMAELRTKDEASTYFPDQAILLRFERRGGRILVSCGRGDKMRKAYADEWKLLPELRSAGRAFFEKLSILNGYPGYGKLLADLSE